MKTIILPADASQDLSWKIQKKQAYEAEQILWEFDFKLEKSRFSLDREVIFNSCLIALETFSQEMWQLFSEKTQGIILYKGSLEFIKQISEDLEGFSLVDAADFLGDFLQRLMAVLPENVKVYSLFERTPHFSPSQTCQLLAKHRFQHLLLSLTPDPESTKGLLLPPDELWTADLYPKIDKLLEKNQLRLIPEKLLNEMWNGLNELLVFKNALSRQGMRQVEGFQAAEGVVTEID